ncbi:hypothetical protein B4109_0369 [Geobacillus stearothermophilus]|uniref:Uncharacterized protein n=1 Tax=Geobacillus stearothermophilus TaxID=1422 RepID=A0A150ML72_GEOSE|nr:hypothetical protein B4109_0369 [Geobacillus stearothermophilus]
MARREAHVSPNFSSRGINGDHSSCYCFNELKNGNPSLTSLSLSSYNRKKDQ